MCQHKQIILTIATLCTLYTLTIVELVKFLLTMLIFEDKYRIRMNNERERTQKTNLMAQLTLLRLQGKHINLRLSMKRPCVQLEKPAGQGHGWQRQFRL